MVGAAVGALVGAAVVVITLGTAELGFARLTTGLSYLKAGVPRFPVAVQERNKKRSMKWSFLS